MWKKAFTRVYYTIPILVHSTVLANFLGLTFDVCDALGSTLAEEKASVTEELPHRTAVVSAAHTLMKIIKVFVSKSFPKWSTDNVTAFNSKRFFNVVKGVLLYCILEINTRSLTILLVTKKYWNLYRMIGKSKETFGLGRSRKMLQQHIRYNSAVRRNWNLLPLLIFKIATAAAINVRLFLVDWKNYMKWMQNLSGCKLSYNKVSWNYYINTLFTVCKCITLYIILNYIKQYSQHSQSHSAVLKVGRLTNVPVHEFYHN